MSALSKLRRMVGRDGVSVREAARRLGMSRTTAAKWLRAGAMVEPRYVRRGRPAKALEPYKEQLQGWMRADVHRVSAPIQI